MRVSELSAATRRRYLALRRQLDPDDEIKRSVFYRKIERFFSRVQVDPETQCALYTGTIDQDGYGQVRFCNRLWRAHILAYYLAGGRVPLLRVLAHTCQNRHCVNVRHLKIARREYAFPAS